MTYPNVYMQGYQAYLDGVDVKGNPYTHSGNRHAEVAWIEGWLDAFTDEIEGGE